MKLFDLGYDVDAVPLYQGISVPKMFKKAFRTWNFNSMVMLHADASVWKLGVRSQ